MATSIAYGPILVKVVEKLSAGFDIKKEVRFIYFQFSSINSLPTG